MLSFTTNPPPHSTYSRYNQKTTPDHGPIYSMRVKRYRNREGLLRRRLRPSPYGRQATQSTVCDWPRTTGAYHTTGSHLSDKVMWLRQAACWDYQGIPTGSALLSGPHQRRAHLLPDSGAGSCLQQRQAVAQFGSCRAPSCSARACRSCGRLRCHCPTWHVSG
jgi:hypothetical protein